MGLFKKAKQTAQSAVASANLPALPDLKNYKDKGEARRIALWAFWTLNTLIDIVYMGMTFATCSRLAQMEFEELKSFDGITSSIEQNAWSAPIAAAALGGIMVLVFNIMSCVVLMRKSINPSGPGFGYGFIMAWCFMMTFYLILCGLVLDAFSDTVEADVQATELWSGYYTQIYKGTVIFSYICSAMFLLFFLCLLIFQGGLSKTMGLYDANTDTKRQLELAAVARAAQAHVAM